MKQHITIEQLNELDIKAKERLREWWKPQWGDLVEVGKARRDIEEDRKSVV